MQRNRYYGLLASSLSFLLVAGLRAQAPSQPSPMTIHVSVSTRAGDPVLNLRPDDFSIADNKHPEPILSVREIPVQTTPVIIVLDDVNLPYTAVSYARQQLANYLSADGGHLRQPTKLALIEDTGVKIQPAFTTNGNNLRDDLAKVSIGLRPLRRSAGFYGAAERLQISLNALNGLAQQRAPKGPTLILWISAGWPLLSGPRVYFSGGQQQQIFANVVRLTTMLRRNQIIVDMVNPFGATENVGAANYYEVFQKAPRNAGDAQLGNLGLQVVALHTGGEVQNGSNDVAGSIKRLVRQTTAGYELTFQPAPGDHDNEYHQLEVKVRGSGLRVATTAGYYARPVLSEAAEPLPTPTPE